MKILEIPTSRRKTGNRGEDLATKHLRKNKYKILCRNYVGADTEIDIIAENKTTLAFIEVKTRTVGHENPREARPAAAVTPEKQRKIISAAKYYLGTHSNDKRISLDIIEVYINADKSQSSILHIENAFNINTAYNKRK